MNDGKAWGLIAERGYDGAINLAQRQRRGATDQSGRAYWDRVLEEVKAAARKAWREEDR